MPRRHRKTLTPHVGTELPKQDAPGITDTVIAAFLAVLFVGCAIYAALVGGFGWAIAVVLGFLGLVSASMAVEQTHEILAKGGAAMSDRSDEWPAIWTPDK